MQKNAQNHAKISKNAKKITKKIVQLWKISTRSTAAAATLFHLCLYVHPTSDPFRVLNGIHGKLYYKSVAIYIKKSISFL